MMTFETMIKIKSDATLMELISGPEDPELQFRTVTPEEYAERRASWSADMPIIDNVINTVGVWKARVTTSRASE